MDNGASIGLEYRYGVMRHVEAVAFRTNIDRTIQFTGKWDPWRQGEKSLPLSVSPFVAVEGAAQLPRALRDVDRRDGFAQHATTGSRSTRCPGS